MRARKTSFEHRLKEFRQQSYWPGKVKSLEAALRFVNQRGFVFFWPIQGCELPSLWVAAAGWREVPSNHDDPGHITWGWKDRMLGQRKWYYAKVLRKKGTMISLEAAPFFYRLSENYGSPEEDYLTQYQEGRLSPEAKAIYETLLSEGPLYTQELRRRAKLSDKLYRFAKGLDELQADFKVLPAAVVEAGRWNYAYVYDLTHRHFPQLAEKAKMVDDLEARRKILDFYFRSVGAATPQEIHRLFGWERTDLEEALEQPIAQGSLLRTAEKLIVRQLG